MCRKISCTQTTEASQIFRSTSNDHNSLNIMNWESCDLWKEISWVFFPMQLVSSKSNVWVRSYTLFTSAYQNRFLESTSNNHNSLYRTNWVAYFIWNERPLNYPSKDTIFTQIQYRSKELWSIYFSLSKQSTKGQIWHYLNFKGTLVIPYDIMDGNMCIYTCIWV